MKPTSSAIQTTRPFDFVHDITKIYFTFTSPSWFYTNTSYSDEFVRKNGYKFDGQFFYKEKS